MLTLENVSKSLGEKNIISNLSFSFGGQLLAITGKNGVGKTTLLNLLAGLLNADSGNISYSSHAPATKKVTVSYAPSRLSFGLNVPPRFFVETLMRAKSDGLKAAQLDRLWQDWQIPANAQRVHDLSFGNVQKLNLIQAMNTTADIYIFDEPTNGLDQQGKDLFISGLASLSQKRVILCSHDLATLSTLSGQIYTLTAKQGRSELTLAHLRPSYEVSYQLLDKALSIVVDAVNLNATLNKISTEGQIKDVVKLPPNLEQL
jgi:ABC-2 type transport system ATP-binding protein